MSTRNQVTDTDRVALWLGDVRTGAHQVLRRSGLAARIGEARLYRRLAGATPDLRAALGA